MPRPIAALFVCALLGATAANSAPRHSADAGESAAGNPDKVVCKRFTRIGSLVAGYRTCKTKREWERERADHQDLGRVNSCRMADNHAEPCK